jgi:drug/metabolite transporter (DMT)-like permease
VSRAVLFPASVPAVTVLIGTVALDEVPGATQVAGLAVVSVGLFVAVGAIWPVLARTTASRTSERLY